MFHLKNQMLLVFVIFVVSMAQVFATSTAPSFVEISGEELAANNQEADEAGAGDEMDADEEADLDEVGSEDELPPIDEEMSGDDPEGL